MARNALAQATSFVHLIGLRRTPKAEDDKDPKAEDDKEDERAQRAGEDDDEYSARMSALDAKEEEDKEKAAAQKEEDDKKAKEDDDDKKAAEDDDKDKKAAATATVETARLTERARCAAILGSPYAADNVAVACHLAFETDMTRTQAIQTLKTVALSSRAVQETGQPAAPKPGDTYRAAMAKEPVFKLGSQPERPAPTGPKAFADAMLAVDKRRRGVA
jgi:hypothetical protein